MTTVRLVEQVVGRLQEETGGPVRLEFGNPGDPYTHAVVTAEPGALRWQFGRGKEAMIAYHGRQMPCFMERRGCPRTAEYRFENETLILHLCAEHREAFGPGTLTALASEGEVDVLNASSLDNASLRQVPHVVEANDTIVPENSS